MLITIITFLFVGYIFIALTLYFMQSSFLYQPTGEMSYSPKDIGMDHEEVTLETEDRVKLNAWFITAVNAKITILFCHGNGGNISHRLDSIDIFNNLGLNVLIFDYRGYGQSQGKTTEEGTYLDAMTAYKWLTETKNIAPENIILFGRSLGGTVAAELATKVKIRALAMESCFTSYADMGKKLYPYMPVRIAARFTYDTVSHVKKIDKPILIIHSPDDEIIPFEFGQKLYEAAGEPKTFVEIFGGHNDGFLISAEIYKKAWEKWLKSLNKTAQFEPVKKQL